MTPARIKALEKCPVLRETWSIGPWSGTQVIGETRPICSVTYSDTRILDLGTAENEAVAAAIVADHNAGRAASAKALVESHRELMEVLELTHAAMWDAHYGKKLDVADARAIDDGVYPALATARRLQPTQESEDGT